MGKILYKVKFKSFERNSEADQRQTNIDILTSNFETVVLDQPVKFNLNEVVFLNNTEYKIKYITKSLEPSGEDLIISHVLHISPVMLIDEKKESFLDLDPYIFNF
jgi:hypothetical protein